jgi:peroxiredoxin
MASLEGVNIGDNVPVKKVKTIYGKILNLSDSKYEYVLVFYRGSWCPYCVNQLKSIESDILPNIKPKQKIVAISVDKNVVAKKMKSKFKLNYEIVSDPKAQLLRAFNIANKIDDELVKKYKNTYSIDIEEDSGEKHHIVAHPAVFIIKNGKIKYKDIHINYKERTKNEEIIKNLK